MSIETQQRFRAQIYCQDQAGRLSLTDPVDVFASTIEEAADKITGGGVSEKGTRDKLAAKVWDVAGNSIRTYYRN